MRVFCSSASLLKSSLAGMVYCIARDEEAIVEGWLVQLAREAQRLRKDEAVGDSVRCDAMRCDAVR